MKDRYVSQRVVAKVMLIVLLAVAAAAASRVAVADEVIFEGFDSPDGFTSTHPDQFVFSDGELNWTACRGPDYQILSRSIPSFSGDVRLTVRGRINSYVNNHFLTVGIGDEPGNGPGTGVGIQFGFTGGGCSRQGPFIWGDHYTQNEFRRDGLPDDAQPDSCSGWFWTWLHPALGQYYTAELVISGGNATLTVPGLGSASGPIAYDGSYDTLFITSNYGTHSYCMSGAIDWVEIEPLGNIPPTVDAGGPYSGDEGSAIPLDGATASDPDGDLLDYSWSVDDPDTCSFDDASALNPNLTCSDDVTYQVTLTVNDGQSDPVSDSASVEVSNVAPTFEAGADETLDPCVVGAFSRAGITFSDPGDDVWSGTVNWGDQPDR